MAAFLARRLVQGVIVVALVATIVFLLMHAAKGDPFGGATEDPRITEAVRQSWRHAYNLDRPTGEQFASYVANVFRGQLGFSFSKGRWVADVLRDALPNTVLLMALGLAGGFALGIVVATIQVRNRGRLPDRILGGVSLVFFAMPDFWLAAIVLAVLPALIPKLPVGGAIDPLLNGAGAFRQLGDRILHIVLPALTLALLYFPVIARHQRASLLEVLPSEYITTARAKGVDERTVIRRHAMRNALLPVVTILGVAFPALLTGAVFVETVFSWPGMGLVIVRAIDAHDYPLITATAILGAAFVVAGSILADSLYRLLDPRIRDER